MVLVLLLLLLLEDSHHLLHVGELGCYDTENSLFILILNINKYLYVYLVSNSFYNLQLFGLI